jgi:hypothetical protein
LAPAFEYLDKTKDVYAGQATESSSGSSRGRLFLVLVTNATTINIEVYYYYEGLYPKKYEVTMHEDCYYFYYYYYCCYYY